MNGQHGNSHLLIMLACCAVPMVGLVLVRQLGIPLDSLATWALVLMCPLLHLFMMRGMRHGSHGSTSCHKSQPESVNPPRQG